MARRGMFQRGNIWWLRYAGPDGKVIRESTGFEKFREAEALLLKKKSDIKEGKTPEIRKIINCTFNELADKYIAWMTGRHRSAYNKACVINQMRESFGNKRLREFTYQLVEQFQTDLMAKQQEKKAFQKLKPATVNKGVGILKAMLKKAVDWSLLDESIHKTISKVKHLPENNKRLRYLTIEEASCLVSQCDQHLKPIVIFALNTGCRLGEILSLKWDQVDLKHGFILLDITKTDSRREIPINATLKGVLQGLTRRLDVPYVFFDPATGKPFQRLKRSFPAALKRVESHRCPDCSYQKTRAKSKEHAGNCPACGSALAVRKGIDDFHFHDLRHTFASHLVMAGIDITTVSRLLGHKSLTMTLRYAHLAPNHVVSALDVLDQTLNESRKTASAQKVHIPAVDRVTVNA